MDTTAFLERCRQSGSLPTTSENWDDNAILAEATEGLRTTFAEEMVNTGSGYWRVQQVFSFVQNQNEYRIPQRAVMQGLQKLETSIDGGQTWIMMKLVTLGSDGNYESQRIGQPTHFTHYGDYIRVFPTPSTTLYKYRMTFYLSPSQLIPTVATGVVVSTPTSSTIRVSGNPTFLSVSGGLLDVINTTGTNEVVLFDVPYSTYVSAGGGNYDITITGGVSLSKLFAGQVVRVADTTDQIPLPREMHQTFAIYTIACVLEDLGDTEQAAKLLDRAARQMRKLIDLAIPRDKAHPQKIKPRSSWLRRNAGRSWR